MTPDLFRKLAALGLSNDQMAGVLEIMEADAEVRKAKGRERVQKWRSRQSGNVTERYVTSENVSERLTRVEDNFLPKKISGNKKEKKDTAPAALSDLDAFKAELSPLLDAERLDGIIKHRRAKKGQITGHAARLLIRDVQACGLSMPDAADTMILRGWITVKPDWLQNKQRATAPPKPRTVGDIFRDDAKRMGLIPNDKPPSTIDGHLETGNGSRESGGTGISRRFTVTADILGRLG